MEAFANAEHRAPASLVAGHRLVCPRCRTAQDLLDFFVFSKPAEYADELNTVLKCRAKIRNSVTGKLENCRCIFSPGEKIDFSDQIREADEAEKELARA